MKKIAPGLRPRTSARAPWFSESGEAGPRGEVEAEAEALRLRFDFDFPPPSLDFERDLPLDLDLALPQIGGDLALALPSGVLSSGSGLESLSRSSTVGASAP